MFSYEFGIAVAFIVWIFSLVRLLVMINSQMEKNLNKIGLRLSWLTLAPKPMHMESRRRPFWKNVLKFLLITLVGAPFIFLSWVYVLFVLGAMFFVWEKNAGKPEVVRQYQWKMKNIDMTFDDIIRASMKASDTDPSKFEEVRQSILDEIAENAVA
jgi:hypothetical protein